jgi:hypothetical protein
VRVGSALASGVVKVREFLDKLDRLSTPVEEVPRLERFHQARHADSFLHSQDFKARYEAAVEGTSHRAVEAKQVEKKFNAYFQDGFEAFVRAPVVIKAPELALQAPPPFIRV